MSAENKKNLKERPSIVQALRWAALVLKEAGVPDPDIEAELMLRHILGLKRHELFMERERRLEAKETALLKKILMRREKREPLAYITGESDFRGIILKVTKDVLIPRPETELLVDEALRVLQYIDRPLVIDLCTGSGCIAVALVRELLDKGRDVTVYATDTSGAALDVAARNARANGVAGHVKFIKGDLLKPLEGLPLKADLVISNPPYVAEKEMEGLQTEVRDYEPPGALYGGADGLEIIRRIITDAPQYLRPGGFIILEMGFRQAQAVKEIAGETPGLTDPEIKLDMDGMERIFIVKKS